MRGRASTGARAVRCPPGPPRHQVTSPAQRRAHTPQWIFVSLVSCCIAASLAEMYVPARRRSTFRKLSRVAKARLAPPRSGIPSLLAISADHTAARSTPRPEVSTVSAATCARGMAARPSRLVRSARPLPGRSPQHPQYNATVADPLRRLVRNALHARVLCLLILPHWLVRRRWKLDVSGSTTRGVATVAHTTPQGHRVHHLWWRTAHPRGGNSLPPNLRADSMADRAGVLGRAAAVVCHQHLLQRVSRSVAPTSAAATLTPPSHLEKLNTVCLYWTGGAVIIIIVTLLARAEHRNSGKFAFSHVSGPEGQWRPACRAVLPARPVPSEQR